MQASEMWNLWHGCHKKSEGCQNCYVFRRDEQYGFDTNSVHKTGSFSLPIRRNRQGQYRVAAGTLLWTCFTSDFFLAEADSWRDEAWQMMRLRSDLSFYMVTKRPERIAQCLPEDWGMGYENVTICCTMENQKRADERLPVMVALTLRHKAIICEPLLGPIDFRGRLGSWCEQVSVGGDSGMDARLCDYSWVLGIRQQCLACQVAFHFKQTGANFRKDGRIYHIARKDQHEQARRANINIDPVHT